MAATDQEILAQESRQYVYEAVRNALGIRQSALDDRTGLSLSSVRHHARVLTDEGLLLDAKVRGKRRYYPEGTDGVAFAAALRDEARAACLDAVRGMGGATVTLLADELGLDPGTVSYHLGRLEEDELVVRERDGGDVVTRLSAAASDGFDGGG